MLSTRFSIIKNVALGLMLALGVSACRSQPSPTPEPTPTASPVVIRFELRRADLALANGATPTPVRLALPPMPVTPTPIPTLAPLPLESAPTAVPPPNLTVAPLSAPSATAVAVVPGLPPSPSPVPTIAPGPSSGMPGQNIYNGPITDQIKPRSPEVDYGLPPDQDHLEFKWNWTGEEVRICQLPAGYGFELRLWPDPANDQLPAGVQANIQPLGVADAVAEQEKIAASCDPKTGDRRYTVTSVRDTPAVRQAGGSGYFFWDIAYVQLEPYYVPLLVSMPRGFYIHPSELATPTPPPIPPPTPTPFPYYVTPRPRPGGTIELLAPDSGTVYASNTGPVEFKWQWEPNDRCSLPANTGYGFELRIGSTQPGFIPLGVMDAATQQGQIACDPETGVRSYTVLDLKNTPGVKATFAGQEEPIPWDGHFRWDVALVSMRPYVPPPEASPPRTFEISLNRYTGPLDPFGKPLTCTNFKGWTEAQAVYRLAGGPNKDPHQLDPDGNGWVCDDLRK